MKGFDTRQEQGCLLFTTASRPALLSSQPRNQRVTEAIFPGVKWLGCAWPLTSI